MRANQPLEVANKRHSRRDRESGDESGETLLVFLLFGPATFLRLQKATNKVEGSFSLSSASRVRPLCQSIKVDNGS